MHKKLIFYLSFFTLFISTITADTVTLISSDGKEFTIDEHTASHSKMMQRLLTRALKEPKTDKPVIVLSSVESAQLKYIVRALTFMSSLYKKYPSHDKAKLQKQVIKAFEDYFKKKQFSIDALRQLLLGADYLDFPALIESLSPIITSQLSFDTFDPKEWETLSHTLRNKLVLSIAQKYFFPHLSLIPVILPQKKLSKEPLGVTFPDNPTDTIPISPNSKFIATTSYYDDDAVENISIWNAYTGKERHVLKGHDGDDLQSLDFSADNKLLVSGSDDETARIWNVKTGQQLHVLSQPGLKEAHFSPDTTLIITRAKKEAGIWDVKTGRQLRTLKGHTASINTAYFSPDSTLVVTASSDKTARIWEVATGRQLHVLEGHVNPVSSALFSPDNKLIITRGDNTVRLWHVKTGKLLHVLKEHTERIYSAIFSSDSKLVLTSVGDGTARLWDIKTGTEIHILKGHTDTVSSALFSPDDQLIITASHDHTVRIWDVKTGRQLYVLQMYDGPVYRARFSPDMNYIVTTGGKAPIIWDFSSIQDFLSDELSLEQSLFIKLLADLPKWQDIASLADHTKHYNITDLQNILDSFIPPIKAHLQNRFKFFISPIHANQVTLISSDGKEFIIDENAATLLSSYTGTLSQEAFEEARERKIPLNTILSDYLSHIVKALRIVATIYEKPITSLSPIQRKSNQENVIEVLTQYFRAANLSSHTLLQLLITADLLGFPELTKTLIPFIATDLSLQTVDPKHLNVLPINLQKRLVATIHQQSIDAVYPIQKPLLSTIISGHMSKVSSAQFNSNNALIVTASWDPTPRVWDARTGFLIYPLTGHTNWINSAQFSPDNKLIITTSWDKTARIWDVKTGTLIHTLEGHYGSVSSAQFSSDGSKIVTASEDRTARIWDTQTGRLMHTLRGHAWEVTFAQFSSDNKLIVTTSLDFTIGLWDAQTGTLINIVTEGADHLSSAQFSPDNKLIVTANLFIENASTVYTARVWDTNSGDHIHTLRGHMGPISSTQFSPDGTKIVTASVDNTARIWDVKTGTHIHMLLGHRKSVTSAQFSHDNKLIVTASWDGTARIWDVQTGTLIHTLWGHTNELSTAQFSPDGTKIVTASWDKTARIWDLTPIADYVLGNLSLEQVLFVKLLADMPKGQTFVSLAQHTKHFIPADLQRIFKNFTPFIQKDFQIKYDLKELTLAKRRRRMQRRLALRRRQLQTHG